MIELLKTIQSSDIVERLGWTLLHTLWLGACVAAAFGVATVMLRRRSANARYLTGCAALVIMVALSVAAFFVVSHQPVRLEAAAPVIDIALSMSDGGPVSAVDPVEPVAALSMDVPGAPMSAVDVSSTSTQPPLLERTSKMAGSALPWVVLFWAGGVAVLTLWQLGGWIAAERIKRLAARPRAQHFVNSISRLAIAMQVSRPVRVLESMLVRVPTVIGWLRPVILLPVGMATGLTAEQLNAIIAHELAHIRRHDYLINLLQSLAETLLFYHPAVWFISRRIRSERENCCDDIVVAAGADRLAYAEALLHLVQRSYESPQGGSLAATAALGATGKPSQLRRRVRRLLSPAEQSSRSARSWPITLALLAAFVLATVLLVNVKAETGVGNGGSASQPAAQPGDVVNHDPGGPVLLTVADLASHHRELTGEEVSLDALKKYYTDLAMREAQSGGDPHDLERTLRCAMVFVQDEATLVQLYVYLGDAHWRQTAKYTPEVWVPQRRKATKAYLDGLSIVLRHELPAEPPELPGVGSYTVIGSPDVVAPYKRRHEREMAARKEAQRVRQLVQFRRILTGQIVQMYARQPDDFEQLHQLVLNRFGVKEVADALVAGARAHRADAHAPPVVLTLPSAWGKAVNGLRSGIRYRHQRRDYRMGEAVHFALLVRNIGDKAITLSDYIPMSGRAPTVRTVDGKLLRVNVPPFSRQVQRRTTTLKPGDILEVGTVSLQLGPRPEGRGGTRHVVDLTPGQYVVSQVYRFADTKQATWSGELTTGDLGLSVAPADELSDDEVHAPTQERMGRVLTQLGAQVDREAVGKDPSAPDDGPIRAARIRKVTFQGEHITDETLDQLRGFTFESLMLYQTSVTDEGLAKLKQLPNLKELFLHTMHTAGPGLAHLGELRWLRRLELGGAPISDEMLAHLSGMTQLESLSLMGLEAITDDGIAHLKGLVDLRSLNLYNTRVGDEGLKRLR